MKTKDKLIFIFAYIAVSYDFFITSLAYITNPKAFIASEANLFIVQLCKIGFPYPAIIPLFTILILIIYYELSSIKPEQLNYFFKFLGIYAIILHTIAGSSWLIGGWFT